MCGLLHLTFQNEFPAHFFSFRANSNFSLPPARVELKFGKVLGVGGFCLVREVREIKVEPEEHNTGSHAIEIITEPSPANAASEEEHYDIATARRRMAKYCLRDGDVRYAVKQLHDDLEDLENVRGMIDLAIEAKYLSAISHPNIIKMRAVAACGPMNQGFFLILNSI